MHLLSLLNHTDLTGVRDHVLTKKDYLASQVGNPEGEGKRTSSQPFLKLETNPASEQKVLRSSGMGARGREDHDRTGERGFKGL